MKKYGITANKKLGQNFLIDDKVIDTIVEASEITKEDIVIEIGPGLGTLTQKLLEKAGKVVAIELDDRMIRILKERFFFLPGGFAAVRGITDGNVYFSHNFFLDIFVMFGIFAIPVIFLVIIQIYNLSKIVEKKVFLSFCSFVLFWFICSLTGAHFMSDSYAIVSWSILFFTNKQAKEISI